MFRAIVLLSILSLYSSYNIATARPAGSAHPSAALTNKACFSYLNDNSHLFRAPAGKHEVVVVKNAQPIKSYGPAYGEREMAGEVCNFDKSPRVTFDQIVLERIEEELQRQLSIFKKSKVGSDEREAARETGHAITKACKNTTGTIFRTALDLALVNNPDFSTTFIDPPPTTESLSGFGSGSTRSVFGD